MENIKLENVDIIETLGEIAKGNTYVHREHDFSIDRKRLEKTAKSIQETTDSGKSLNLEDGLFFWLSRDMGTQMCTVKDAYTDDPAASSFTYWRRDKGATTPRYLSYMIKIDGGEIGADGKLHPIGTLYSLDYEDILNDIEKNKLTPYKAIGTYENGEVEEIIIHSGNKLERYHNKKGNLINIEYEPKDMYEFRDIIFNLLGKYDLTSSISVEDHLNELDKDLTKKEAARIVRAYTRGNHEIELSPQYGSLAEKHFTDNISIEALKSYLPFKETDVINADKSTIKGIKLPVPIAIRIVNDEPTVHERVEGTRNKAVKKKEKDTDFEL